MARHNEPVWESVRAEITRRVAVLRERPYIELANLPEHHTEEANVPGEAISYTTYRVADSPGWLQIVVQGYRKGKDYGLFRTGQCYAEGFRASAESVAEIMREDELYDYM